MWFTSLLQSLRPGPERSRENRVARRKALRGRASQWRRFVPRLEVLEDRQLLSSFLVVLGTDNGGLAGQMVSATSGDLRYCVEQADAVHAATTDSIGFSSTLTSSPHTITLNSANGPLVLSDSHPLTIKGPTAHTISVSGGGQVEVFDIVSGTVTINNLAIIYGNAANGGGIYNQGTLTLTGCFLNHDSANAGDGGGIFNVGTLQLAKCTLYRDSASNYGGGIMNQTSGTLTLTGCTLRNDTAGNAGACIFNQTGGTLTLTQCTLSNGMAGGSGGGIYNSGTATLTKSTLSNDAALSGGSGGIGNVGTLTLTQCTLSNDWAPLEGGGIDNFSGTATLTNCTLSNDTSPFGGGINNFGTATLTNCTLSNNSASQGGGIFTTGTLNLTNTIVAGNTAVSSGPDIFGAVATADHNLIGDATGSSGITNGVNGNIAGTSANPIDPLLGPLQNNGGPTQTMALLAGSPAIGHADNAAAPATDQRGLIRIDEAGETSDIGAFEL